MTNFTAQAMWNSSETLEPSPHLDVMIAQQQKDLLASTHKNTLMGFISCDAQGKGAKNKAAKRQINMISGNIASCSRCLNDAKRLKQLEEVNQWMATTAEVTAEAAKSKKQQQVKAAQKLRAKKSKKKADEAKEAADRAKTLSGLQTAMDDKRSNPIRKCHSSSACQHSEVSPCRETQRIGQDAKANTGGGGRQMIRIRCSC